MGDAAPSIEPAEVLTIVEAAALCRVSTDVLYRLAAEGAVPAMKVGGQWRVVRSELLRWLVDGGACSTSTRAAANGGARSRSKGGSPSTSRSTASPSTKRTASPRSASAPEISTRARLLRAVKGT